MSTNITPESKNDLAITNESKVSMGKTWNTIEGTWDERATDTWDIQSLYITKESKNDLSVTNESKN